MISWRLRPTARRDAALASGVQYSTTDCMRPGVRFTSGYEARLPGDAAALCNPVRAAGRCGDVEIEQIAPAPPAY